LGWDGLDWIGFDYIEICGVTEKGEITEHHFSG
jgi:hypothetical protein